MAVAGPEPRVVVPTASKEPRAVARGREGNSVSPGGEVEGEGASSGEVRARGVA